MAKPKQKRKQKRTPKLTLSTEAKLLEALFCEVDRTRRELRQEIASLHDDIERLKSSRGMIANMDSRLELIRHATEELRAFASRVSVGIATAAKPEH